MHVVPEWLGPFARSGNSWLDCEVLTLEKTDPDMRQAQWEGLDTAWFDYVRAHPVQSFYYFCHCYGNAFGDYLGSYIDHDLRFSRGLKGDPLDHRELRSLLTLKNMADKRGMPYRMWLTQLFNEYAARGWIRPPRPAHLLNNTEGIEKVYEYWLNITSEQTIYAADSWFDTAEWVGHPQQVRYEQWIVDNINMRQNKEFSLCVALYEKRCLRIERAAVEYGPLLIAQAQDWRMQQLSQS